MNQLLQKAFERAAELPEEEQARFALFLLAELESERQWAELFARPESEDLLESLADEAPQTNVALSFRTYPLDSQTKRVSRNTSLRCWTKATLLDGNSLQPTSH